jgi:HlyD family secretion protein
MDIARTPPRRTRRNLMIVGGVATLVAITAWTLTLEPASQTIERSAVLIDSVRRGDVVREVRGPGTLVPEHIRWITAQASARVERLASESRKQLHHGELLL